MPKYRDEGWLREQYVEEHRTTTEIAEECGCAPSTVSTWLNKHDIEARPPGGGGGGGPPAPDERLTDVDWLREQYVGQRRNTHEIADVCGCARSTVSRWLNKHDIETRTTKNPVTDQRLTDTEWLREQHVKQRRSAPEIADECGCSQTTVLRRLRKHGIEATQSNADRRLTDAEWLREQYVEQRRSAHDIAEERGCAYSTVYRWLRKHDIETTQSNVDRRLTDADWLREQYVEECRSTIEIADECGCDRRTVSNWLNKHDIETRSSAAGLSGEENPQYNGGSVPYGPGWNRRKRAEVRERDDYTCQDSRCSVSQAEHLDEYGQKLHVHHLRKARDVEDPEDRNAKANLITLCRDCHYHWEQISETGLVPEVV